jgi:adenosylcobinamide kinase / adenosylcobinamide-phosphate guanylyltransferase
MNENKFSPEESRPSSPSTPLKMLILGGCRSGKSRFAEQWVSSRFTRRTFIATLQPSPDPEVEWRIALHQRERGQGWQTMEEPLNLVASLEHLQDGESEVVLVDCLTLWLSNLLLKGLDDQYIQEEVLRLGKAVQHSRLPVILVANEVGLGVVPEHKLGRRFRDLAGWTNQRLAEICNPVLFIAAGLPLVLKGSLPGESGEG